MRKGQRLIYFEDPETFSNFTNRLIERVNCFLNPGGFKVQSAVLAKALPGGRNEPMKQSSATEYTKKFMVSNTRRESGYDFLELSLTATDSASSGSRLSPVAAGLLDSAVSAAFSLAVAEEKSRKDLMTGLLNKSAFMEALSQIVETASLRHLEQRGSDRLVGTDGPVHVMMADIDDFKMFNSLFGYVVGDSVIKAVASVLSGLRREESKGRAGVESRSGKPGETSGRTVTAARYGGEEFVAVFTGFEAEEVLSFCEAFRERVTGEAAEIVRRELTRDKGIAPEVIGSIPRISISLGLFSWNSDFSCASGGESMPSMMVNRAASALGMAKEAGKNRVVQFSEVIKSHGRVSEVLPGGREVRINLGHFHGIQPDMCFEIIDRDFNGNSGYLSQNGREKVGIKPERTKALVRVNQVGSGQDEIQERMSFAKVIPGIDSSKFDSGTDWAIRPGDILRLIEGPVRFETPMHLEFGNGPRSEPAWFCTIKVTSRSSLGSDILERFAGRTSNEIDAALTGRCARLTVCNRGGKIRAAVEGIQWETLEKVMVSVCRRTEKISKGEISLVAAFCGISDAVVPPGSPCKGDGVNSIASGAAKTDILTTLPEVQNQSLPVLYGAKWANLIGRNHFAKGNISEAEAYFNEASRLDPNAWQPIGNLGVVYMRRQMHGKAMAFFRRALEISGGSKGDIHNNMGYLLLRIGGDPAEAAKHLGIAIDLDGPCADTFNALSIALQQIEGRASEAVAAARAALDLEPDTPEYLDSLLTSLLKAELTEDALRAAEKLMSYPEARTDCSTEFSAHALMAARAAGDVEKETLWSTDSDSGYGFEEDNHV